MSTSDLLIDGGQSACRLAVLTGDQLSYSTELPGLAFGRDKDGVATVLAFLAQVQQQLRAGAALGFRSVWLGLTGMPGGTDQRRAICREAMDILEADLVAACADVVPAYVGALGLQPGAVLSAGSGAVALAFGSGGTSHVTGGHGALLGDQGSAYWIGRAALRAVTRARDGWGPVTLLSTEAEAHYGPLDHVAKMLRGAENPVDEVAQFARPTCAAAEAGDEVAAEIVQRAGGLLAHMLWAAARQAHGEGVRRVKASWNGQLLHAQGPLSASFAKELLTVSGGSLELAPPLGGPLDGLRTMALAPSLDLVGAHVYTERMHR